MNPSTFRFDRYTLDLARASLRAGDEEIVLRRKSFDVLRYMVENPGRVVTKDEIFAAVWPDVTVTDDSLVQCIRDIRQATKDDAQRLIKTVPRRGYLFDAAVTPITPVTAEAPPATTTVAAEQPAGAPSSARPYRGVIWGLLAAAAVALAAFAAWPLGLYRYFQPVAPAMTGPPSIAVLFFAAGDDNARTYDYFSDGLTDDVIAALGRFSGLRVIASSSLNAYKGSAWEPQQLWRDLKVRYIVDGSVRRSGDRLRVSARLINAEQGVLLWSETHDEEIKDVFAVQDRVARSIVGRLAVRISAIEQQRAALKPTSNMEAYDYVLRGRERLARITRADNLEARRLFRTAAELDTRYAASVVGLGQTYHSDLVYGWGVQPGEALRRAYEAANQAIVLDDKDPAGHLLLANIYVLTREYALALAEADRGIELNPNDADGHAARAAVLVWMGRIDDSIAAFETAAQFDPTHSRPRSLAHLGLAYFLAGRFDDAVRAFERSIGRNPEFALAYIGLAAAYAEQGKRSEAERAAELVRRVDPFFASTSFGTQFAQDAHRLRMVESLQKAGL